MNFVGRKIQPGGVFLVNDGQIAGDFGTAFVIHQDGAAAYLLTCAHVVRYVEPENLRVGGCRATVVAEGKEGRDPDLAVLRVEELKDKPCWTLKIPQQNKISFSTEGFCREGEEFYQRKLIGKLGERIPIVDREGRKSSYGWDLDIESKRTLRQGNSGSPVWDRKRGCVLGVVSRRQIQGHEGFAISVEALQEIWPEMPADLIQNSSSSFPAGKLAVGLGGAICLALLVVRPPQNFCPKASLSATDEFQQPSSSFTDTVRIGGSTSMVDLNRELGEQLNNQYPGIDVTTTASSSGAGLRKLKEGNVDIAAISGGVSSEELQQNDWKAFTIAPAPIAVVIGSSNPYPKRKGLTTQQVRDIYTGEITNWSQLQPDRPEPIRAINRYIDSGTRGEFQKEALGGDNFGLKIETWPRDATTEVLRVLEKDGIYYAACHQVANQRSFARILPINDQFPADENYPYSRSLKYVYSVDGHQQPSEKVAAFLWFVDSKAGREIISDVLSADEN